MYKIKKGKVVSFPPGVLSVFVRRLAVVGFPETFCNFHFGKYRFKRRIFRAAGVDSVAYRAAAFPHMADTHLLVFLSVKGTFNTEVVFPAAEPVPYRPDRCVDSCGRPVGISVVGHYASKMLEFLCLIFHSLSQSPLRSVRYDDTALIVTVMAAVEFCFHRESEKLFIGFHLKHRRVIISENDNRFSATGPCAGGVVISIRSLLMEQSAGSRDHFSFVTSHFISFPPCLSTNNL